MTDDSTPLIRISGLSHRFPVRGAASDWAPSFLGGGSRYVHALDGIELELHRREVLGVVGESGCGKSTLGRIAVGLLKPSSGLVQYDGRDRYTMSGCELIAARCRTQMIFQDPFDSLNPRMKVDDIIGQAPAHHQLVARSELREHVHSVMHRCGLDPGFSRRFPHQLSGGQRQRVGIARAIAVRPEVLICDESVASLDVSVQAQVLNLFLSLREQLGLSYLFISHDLAVIRHMADRVVVMYLGRIVESGTREQIFSSPLHPYTQGLLAAVGRLDRRRRVFTSIKGEVPSAITPPTGCHFHPRCSRAAEICRLEVPALGAKVQGQKVACHFPGPETAFVSVGKTNARP